MYLNDYDILTSSNNGILQEISRNLVDEVPSTWSPIVSCILHGHKRHSGLLHHTWMSKLTQERFPLPETGRGGGVGCYNFPPCHKFTYTSYWTLIQPHLVSFNHITSLPAIRIDPDLKETRQWRTRIHPRQSPGNANHERNPWKIASW